MDKNIYLAQFYGKSQNYTQIPREWFSKYGVKRGLRNEDHTGVLVGLTRIADVVGYQRDEKGQKVDCDGVLYYRGIDIRELAKVENYRGYLYEEASFLLLFGYLPTEDELNAFCKVLQNGYDLPDDFLEMNLLRLPGKNLMNKLQHALLTLCAGKLSEGGLRVFSGPHQAGTVSFLPGMDCEDAARRLAEQGIAVRAGLHCAPLAHESAGTVETGTVRLSFGFDSHPEQLSHLERALSRAGI